jgi:hypothetical protein
MKLNVRTQLIATLAVVMLGIAPFPIKSMLEEPALQPDVDHQETEAEKAAREKIEKKVQKQKNLKLTNQSAKIIAQQIWARKINAPTPALENLDTNEESKEFIRDELFKKGGVVDAAVTNWKREDFSSLKNYPEWLRFGFARKYYLRHEDDISNQLGISDIGGFSIEELLAYKKIPSTVSPEGGLNLSNYKINDMTGFSNITGLENLQSLNLNDNLLTKLPTNIFTNKPLQALYLSGNQFTTIPAGLANLHELNYLALDNNPLQNMKTKSYQGADLQKLLNQLRAQ